MEARARLRNYRVSAQKARLVANEIRGRGVDDALTILDLSTKRFAKPLAKLVRSAVANADEKNNRDHAGIDLDNLVVKEVTVDQGSSMWRIRARAQGRAAWIQHRTSHIQVVLNED
ncbi:MAG: 50S ribosomal protein L22 [Deltaproteobacteria bacterium]|jgi:large subunit ribosomal protein L22|nr:50S ribosomal protein L22 [Deltaproteobacteria bacterium]MBW2665730.1 50S ribosomal protein L22 [Deltaproteobacteria bacterium]